MQTKKSFIHGSKNSARGFYDNSSFNYDILNHRYDENKKHVCRKRGDDGLNMLLDEVRAKFQDPNRNSSPNKRQFLGTHKEYFFQLDSTKFDYREIYQSNHMFSSKIKNQKSHKEVGDQSLKHAWIKLHENQPKETCNEHARKSQNHSICIKKNPNDIEMHATKIMESYLQKMNMDTKYGMDALDDICIENRVHITNKNKHNVNMNKSLNENLQKRSFDAFQKESEDFDINDLFPKKKSSFNASSDKRKHPKVECHMGLEKNRTCYKNANIDAFDNKEINENKKMPNSTFINKVLQNDLGMLQKKGMEFENQNSLNLISTNEMPQIKLNMLQDSYSKIKFNKKKEHPIDSYIPMSESHSNTIKSKNAISDQVVPSLHYIQKTSQIAIEILDGIVKKLNSDHAQKILQKKELEESIQNESQTEQCENYELSNKNVEKNDAHSFGFQEISTNIVCNKNVNPNITTTITNFCIMDNNNNNYHNHNNANEREFNQVDDSSQKMVHQKYQNLALMPIKKPIDEILEHFISNDTLQHESIQKCIQHTTQANLDMQLDDMKCQTSTNLNFHKQRIQEVQYKTQMEWEAKLLEVETNTHDPSISFKNLNPHSSHDNTTNLLKHDKNDIDTKYSSNLYEHNLSYCSNLIDLDIKGDKNKVDKFHEIPEDVQCHFRNLHSFEINNEVYYNGFCQEKDLVEDVHIQNQSSFKQDLDNITNIGKIARDYYQTNVARKCQVMASKSNYSSSQTLLFPNEENNVHFDKGISSLLAIGHNNIEEDLNVYENTL